MGGISYVTWYWHTVGQGLLSLERVMVEGECFYFFCFLTFIHFAPPSPPTSSSISLPPFSERWHKMTHKGWCVIKLQYSQLKNFAHVQLACATFWTKALLEPIISFGNILTLTPHQGIPRKYSYYSMKTHVVGTHKRCPHNCVHLYIQSNFNGSNIYGITEIGSRCG